MALNRNRSRVLNDLPSARAARIELAPSAKTLSILIRPICGICGDSCATLFRSPDHPIPPIPRYFPSYLSSVISPTSGDILRKTFFSQKCKTPGPFKIGYPDKSFAIKRIDKEMSRFIADGSPLKCLFCIPRASAVCQGKHACGTGLFCDLRSSASICGDSLCCHLPPDNIFIVPAIDQRLHLPVV